MNKFLGSGLMAIVAVMMGGTAHAEGMAGLHIGQAVFDEEVVTLYRGKDADKRFISYKIQGGLALGPHLSAHAALFSLGRIKVNAASQFPGYNPNDYRPLQLAIKGFALEGRWQWRSGAAWRPYAKLGGAIVNSTSKANVYTGGPQPREEAEETRSSFAFVPGAGLVWESVQNWGLQLEVESYLGVKSAEGIPDQNISNASLGIYSYW